MSRSRKSHSTLENEVIVAVTILYVLICVTMLAIHYLQPAGQETVTSSSSPSHRSFSTTQGEKPSSGN